MITSKHKFLNYLLQKYYWWQHLFWSISRILKYFFLLDGKNCLEAYYWTKIHLTHKSKRIK